MVILLQGSLNGAQFGEDFFPSHCIVSVPLKGVERIVSGFEGIRKLNERFSFVMMMNLVPFVFGGRFEICFVGSSSLEICC